MMNKYFQKVMITFKQFLDEAKKKKPLYSKKHIEKQLNKQGGIGAKAVEKYIEQRRLACLDGTSRPTTRELCISRGGIAPGQRSLNHFPKCHSTPLLGCFFIV